MHLRAGILGATGAVGQTFVRLLADHPWFEVAALGASERSAGQPYREATHWLSGTPMPERVADVTVQACVPEAFAACDFVFSGLDSSVAGAIERAFAAAGLPVVSNAKNYRMQADVPLLVPEINPGHAALIERQSWGASDPSGDGDAGDSLGAGDSSGAGDGFIVTNPNCSTVGLVCALAPLEAAFGIEAVQVVTMQALSGAGYPGVPSLDAVGNAVPYIGGEEEKMATEPRKILGTPGENGGEIARADFTVSAQCNRVAVIDGHLEAVSLRLSEKASSGGVKEALRAFRPAEAVRGLPSAPDEFIRVFEEERFPQPRRHAGLGGGMTTSVGRVRPCAVMDVKLVLLSHNTVRGAAGGAVLNAELLAEKGYLIPRAQRAEADA